MKQQLNMCLAHAPPRPPSWSYLEAHVRFCLINAGVLYLYFSNYLQIDEEEYGGTWELTKEGFMTSFALFMNLAQTTKSESLGGGAQASLYVFKEPTRLQRSFGSSFTLPSTMTDGAQPPPALCLSGPKDPLSYTTETRLLGGTPATRNLEDPFPGPRISVVGVSVFCKGCDLKLFKEPSTFWGSISQLSITNRFFLDTIMKHLFVDWSCPLIWCTSGPG
eukprot:XP_007104509.1 uncharacterized protein RAB5IF isoform X1 [Physeter catodon]